MKIRVSLAIVIIGTALSAPVFAHTDHTEQCRAVSDKQIAALFDRWNASLQTGDAGKVVANYAKRSVLLATQSNTPRLTAEAKKDYFEHFLVKRPVGKIDSRTIEIDCNTAIDEGLYTFSFGDGSQIKARYTFTYKWFGNKWLITGHHSSVMPEKS